MVAGMYMLAIGMYAVVMGYTSSNISHDPYSYKIQLVAAVAFLDVFLLILGHTWDMMPNMQVFSCAQKFCATSLLCYY